MVNKIIVAAAVIAIVAIIAVAAVVVLVPMTPAVPKLSVSSSAFSDVGTIPQKYTADGVDVSPPVSIGDVPAGAQSLAIIVDDPDAPGGSWVHWVIWNIPAGTTSIPENVPTTETVETLGNAKQGTNDFDSIGYGGPSPPSGTPHRYYFKVYALDTTLNLAASATKADLEAAMQGHILAQGSLMGKYGR